MTTKPEKINSINTKNNLLRHLSQRSKQLAELNVIFQQLIPAQFVAHCSLSNINENTLVIHADNANYASLLRFQSDVLCKGFSKYLPQIITKVDVKVRPKLPPFTTNTILKSSLSPCAATTLLQFADNFEEGALKVSIEKLAQRQKV